MNSIKTSIIKTLTWRLTGSSSTLLISYLVTGSLSTAASVFTIHLFANTFLYFVHERIWEKINNRK